jgi:hypothetical protein
VSAQAPSAPPAAPLLEHLVGHWTLKGTVRGRPVTDRLDAAWTLQHRFLELHLRDVEHTPPQYEARVFIGPDTLPGRVLAHWLDNFGAAYSVPPATGQVPARLAHARLSLSGGAFHDTFVLEWATNTWTIRLDAPDGAGGWTRFAEYRATRR